MKFAHLISRFAGSAWYIRDGALEPMVRVLESRIAGHATPFEVPGEEEPMEPLVPEAQTIAGIATIEVCGVLGRRLDLMESLCGGCDYDHVVDTLSETLAQPSVAHVVMIFDSPGGTHVGCPETYARLRALIEASPKPVIAYTETECCSAAYYLAAACTAIYATPTALVGSIGCKMVLRDNSAANAEAGVKFHVFKSGSMKDVHATYRPPSEEEAKLFQQRIDSAAQQFRRDVLAVRPDVKLEAFDTALYYNGEEAVACGLVDRLVLDLSEVIRDIQTA